MTPQRSHDADELIKDVGYTGLTPQEEFANRERKYSDQNGVDIRKFGNSKKSGWHPQDDPYYGRKQVNSMPNPGSPIGLDTLTPFHRGRHRWDCRDGLDRRRRIPQSRTEVQRERSGCEEIQHQLVWWLPPGKRSILWPQASRQ